MIYYIYFSTLYKYIYLHRWLCFLFNRKPSYDTETDPSEGLMNVLKKIYEDGDDDMKRTINKAWVESREKQAKGDTEFWDFKAFGELWCGNIVSSKEKLVSCTDKLDR